jgi:hypothetical protein
MIYADFRNKSLRDKKYLFLAIKQSPIHYARTTGIAFPSKESARAYVQGYENAFVVKLHKNTIKGLRKMHPYKLGLALSYYLRDRQEY